MAALKEKSLEILLSRRVFFFLPLTFLFSCQSNVEHRPFAYHKMGPVYDIPEGATYREKNAIYLTREGLQFHAMSTLCSRDLDPLVPMAQGFGCQRCGSVFSFAGEVKKGPATVGLEYFELEQNQGDTVGVADTIYVRVGVEKPASYRFTAKAMPRPAGPARPARPAAQ